MTTHRLTSVETRSQINKSGVINQYKAHNKMFAATSFLHIQAINVVHFNRKLFQLVTQQKEQIFIHTLN